MLFIVVFFLKSRRPPRSTLDRSSAASDVYKRQGRAGAARPVAPDRAPVRRFVVGTGNGDAGGRNGARGLPGQGPFAGEPAWRRDRPAEVACRSQARSSPGQGAVLCLS